MKTKNIIIGILGIILIVISKAGIFTKENITQSTGGFSIIGHPTENKLITIPLLIIGIGMILYVAYPLIKSKK